MVTALTLAVFIGIPIGVITAVKQYSKTDYILNAASIFLASVPVFVLGLVFVYVFAVNLRWYPRASSTARAGRTSSTRSIT